MTISQEARDRLAGQIDNNAVAADIVAGTLDGSNWLILPALSAIQSVIDERDAARKLLAEARDVLTPFAHYGQDSTNANGWASSNGHRDCVSDWLGPTDFRRAADLYTRMGDGNGAA